MATTQQSALQKLYVAYFNRPADPGGLAFYDANLTAGRVTMAQISADFAKSSEYQTEYSQATFAGVVDRVYQNLFGRPADAAGKALYVKALTDKTMTVDEMVTWIANGAQGTDKVAFDAKVTVASAFTDALNTPAEVSGYNLDAQAAAKALLATIKTATQATAAVTNIDANVAAVIKAGVEFSLQTGLADLAAAQEAKADFLEGFGEANDIDDATDTDVTDAVAAAEQALVGLIDDDSFANASAGVKAALIDEQEEVNADTLAAAQKSLKTAQDAVAKVTGLNGAISAATSAAEGVDEAEEAALDSMIAYQNAVTNFMARNPTATTPGMNPMDGMTVKVGNVTVAEVKDGEVVIPTGVDASKYAGLTAFVAAANGAIAAYADVTSAMDAKLFADLRVEMLDLESATVLNGAFTFTATTVATPNKPTYNQIVDELSALTSKSVAADAAVAASTPTAPGHAALVTAADNAREALNDFRTEITDFIADNDTKLADAVVRAEEGTLAQAQAAVDGVEDLSAAIEAKAELDAANKVLTTATTDYNTESGQFVVANNATPLTVNTNGTVDVTAGGADVVVLTAGKLVAAAGADDTVYPGLTDYIAAGNARIDAQAAVTAAALTTDEQNLLSDNAAAVSALAAAEAAATSSVAATRATALGTDGAQDAIDALADAQEALDAANAAVDQLDSLDDAIGEAQDAFEANDYNAPSMLNAASAFGTTGSDIFVVNKMNSTITNFGRSGEDVLFIGNGYTLNTGDFAKDGKDDVLEVFFVQSGNNTVVTIETKAFGSNSVEAEIKITLTGVDADDLAFSNGIISM